MNPYPTLETAHRPPSIIRLIRWFSVPIVLVVFVFSLLPSLIDSHFNKVFFSPPYRTSLRAQTFHRTLWIADLHADSLLGGRNLLKESSRGHVDGPRLVKGNVALQLFSFPTKTPWGLNIERNRADSDQITWLAIVEGWPPKTWGNLTARALYQAQRLQSTAEQSQGRLLLIRTSSDLQKYVELRESNPKIVAGLLAVEVHT